ncbi:MAG: redoxin domain-containing protein [Halioglobus sp.]
MTLVDEFVGRNGTVFIASRSVDWCPYCMRQLIQLQENKAAFDAAGIGLVAITMMTRLYSKPSSTIITIPVLSDIDALSFKTLGILNEDYEKGDARYGIPHPGMIIIDPQDKVAGKLFIEAYSSRVDSLAALAFAMDVLGVASPR